MSATADRIRQTCDSVRDMLLEKNAAYGDSASDPLRIFSKADKLEAIRVRIDDKLSRISRGGEYPGDNDVRDLVGYLLLYLANDGTTVTEEAPWGTVRDREGDIWNLQDDGLYMMPHNTTLMLPLDRLTDRYGPLTPVVA